MLPQDGEGAVLWGTWTTGKDRRSHDRSRTDLTTQGIQRGQAGSCILSPLRARHSGRRRCPRRMSLRLQPEMTLLKWALSPVIQQPSYFTTEIKCPIYPAILRKLFSAETPAGFIFKKDYSADHGQNVLRDTLGSFPSGRRLSILPSMGRWGCRRRPKAGSHQGGWAGLGCARQLYAQLSWEPDPETAHRPGTKASPSPASFTAVEGGKRLGGWACKHASGPHSSSQFSCMPGGVLTGPTVAVLSGGWPWVSQCPSSCGPCRPRLPWPPDGPWASWTPRAT